jgi:hypothetical protein
MAAYTALEELVIVRAAIATFEGGASVFSANLGGLSVTYQSGQLPTLMQREQELYRRFNTKNTRKRTFLAITS